MVHVDSSLWVECWDCLGKERAGGRGSRKEDGGGKNEEEEQERKTKKKKDEEEEVEKKEQMSKEERMFPVGWGLIVQIWVFGRQGPRHQLREVPPWKMLKNKLWDMLARQIMWPSVWERTLLQLYTKVMLLGCELASIIYKKNLR